VEVVESLAAVTDTLVAKMAVCEFYSSVYGEALKIELSSIQLTDDLRKTLDLTLPEFYAAVLVFSVKARQYLVPSNGRKPEFPNPPRKLPAHNIFSYEEIRKHTQALRCRVAAVHSRYI